MVLGKGVLPPDEEAIVEEEEEKRRKTQRQIDIDTAFANRMAGQIAPQFVYEDIESYLAEQAGIVESLQKEVEAAGSEPDRIERNRTLNFAIDRYNELVGQYGEQSQFIQQQQATIEAGLEEYNQRWRQRLRQRLKQALPEPLPYLPGGFGRFQDYTGVDITQPGFQLTYPNLEAGGMVTAPIPPSLQMAQQFADVLQSIEALESSRAGATRPSELQFFEYQLSLANQELEVLYNNVIKDGRTPQAVNVLTTFGATPEEIDSILGTFPAARARLLPSGITSDEQKRQTLILRGTSPEETDKIVALSKLDLTSEQWLSKWKEIDPSFKKNLMYGLFSRSFASGIGGMVRGGAGVAGWQGHENWEKNLNEIADVLQSNAYQGDWEPKPELATIFDPRFWQVTVAEALPFTLSIIPVSILGYSAATAGLAAVGVSTLWASVITSLGIGVGSAVVEGGIEAGSAYNEAKARGYSEDDAVDVANNVFLKNVGLLSGTNAVELFATFMPTPGGTLGNLLKKGLVRVITTGTRAGTVVLTEGGQEAVQDVFSRTALGEKVKLDDEMKMQFIIGGIMGGVFFGAGATFTTIQNRIVRRLPAEERAQFETRKQELMEQGIAEEPAIFKALDEMGDNKLVIEIADEVLEQTKREEALKQVQPKNATETLAWAHMGNQLREEIKEADSKGAEPVSPLEATIPAQAVPTPTKGAVVTPPVPPEVTEEITLYRGEQMPSTAKAGIAFAPDRETAEWYAGKTGRVVELKLTREEFDKLEFADLPTIEGQKRVIYYVPQEIYRRTLIPRAEAVRQVPGEPEAGLQPSMIPEEVAGREVRPPGKGRVTQISMEDQLKLEQARRAAEEVPAEVREAYEAQAEIEGLRETLGTDPIAKLRFRVGNRSYSIDNIVDAKEKAFAANDSFILSQAKAIKPNVVFSEANRLRNGRVRADAVLDELAQTYTGGDVNAFIDRVNQIREQKGQIAENQETIKRQMTEQPLSVVPELTTEEVTENLQTVGRPQYTLEQSKALAGFFGEYVMSENTVTAYELQRQLWAKTRAERVDQFKSRMQELIISQGMTVEAAFNQAKGETLTGKLPAITTDFFEDMTNDLREALFDVVYHNEQLQKYPFEMASTITALTNALTGQPIPMKKGTGSVLFPGGGSAWDRLNFVFGEQPQVLKAIEKMATESKPLKDVVDAVFHETGREPIPIDQETADYLRSLPEWGTQKTSGLTIPGEGRGLLVFNPSGKLGFLEAGEQLQIGQVPYEALHITDLRSPAELQFAKAELELGQQFAEGKMTFEQYQLERMKARDKAFPLPPVTRYEFPIEDAIKQMPLFPRPPMDNIIRVLKEIGMSPVDIGNFLRANKASFDFSFWRQQAPLIASHPITFVQANIEAWKALWSQKSAEASWLKITRDPLYQFYEEAETQGGDFLRPLEIKKGTAQWRGVEEYGYLTGERLLPRLTAKLPWVKLSARAFETGTNVHNWLIFKNYYNAMLRLSEQYAVGKKTLRPGEAFDVVKEMVDFSKSLANFTARGSLGKFSATAPELSAFFFAPRAAIGRILSVKDLLNANPRVRREAWKNAALFVSTFGGIVLLGAAVGWWEVERDPRSAEYMSIRIGNTRIDPWGGYRQFLVFFSRAITQTGVSSVTGAEYKTDPLDLMQNFIRGKASPLASFFLDWWKGKNFVGEEFDVTNKKQWVERVAPFAVWDIYEAYKDDPIHGLQSAVPAIVGAGVQTYTGDWRENFAKLGLPKYSDNLSYGIRDPKYDTADFWADTASQFKGVDPATLTEAKGYPEYIRAIAEARIIRENLMALPNEKLVSLNADPAEGATFADYYKMWRDRQKIVVGGDEKALKEFDEKYPKAELGNFSQRQFVLLNEYWSITDKKEQADFLKEHEIEIGVKPRDEWLKSHPKENAQLAIWGQAKLLTKEAYTEFKRLVKELDIPDSALPESTLPPEGSIDAYFERQDVVNEWGANSWEDKLLRAKNPELNEWLGLGEIDTPLASLELKTEKTYRGIYDNLNKEDDPDWIGNLDDKIKDKDGLTARDRARNELKATKIGDMTWIDIDRKIEAIEMGTEDSPTPDNIISGYVEYMKKQDEKGMGANSAEVMLMRVDDPDLDEWLVKNKGLQLVDQNHIPTWRIDAKYRKEDKQYEIDIPARYKGMTDAQVNVLAAPEGVNPAWWAAQPLDKKRDYMITIDRANMESGNNEFRQDRLRREAYQKNVPGNLIETYVTFYESSDVGFWKERMLVNEDGSVTEFGLKVWHNILGNDIPKASDVFPLEYDQLRDDYGLWFDRHEGYGIFKSEYYIDNEDKRKAERRDLFFDTAGEPNDFATAYYKRDGYESKVPEKHLDTWADWKIKTSLVGKPEKWKETMGTDDYFEDDWFLMEHIDFYRELRDKGLIPKADFTNVPSREVFDQYLVYQAWGNKNSPSYIADNSHRAKVREYYRWLYRDFGQWLVDAKDYTPMEKKHPGYIVWYDEKGNFMRLEDIRGLERKAKAQAKADAAAIRKEEAAKRKEEKLRLQAESAQSKVKVATFQ